MEEELEKRGFLGDGSGPPGLYAGRASLQETPTLNPQDQSLRANIRGSGPHMLGDKPGPVFWKYV